MERSPCPRLYITVAVEPVYDYVRHAVYCKFTLYFDYKSWLSSKKFGGGDLSGKFLWWLGTETTWLGTAKSTSRRRHSGLCMHAVRRVAGNVNSVLQNDWPLSRCREMLWSSCSFRLSKRYVSEPVSRNGSSLIYNTNNSQFPLERQPWRISRPLP